MIATEGDGAQGWGDVRSLRDSETYGGEGGVDTTDVAGAGGHLTKVTKGRYSIGKLEVCSTARCAGWWWLRADVLIMGKDVMGIEDGAGLAPKQVGFDYIDRGSEQVEAREARWVHTRSCPGGGDLHELLECDCIAKSGVDDSGMPQFLCVPGERTIASVLEVKEVVCSNGPDVASWI